MIGECHAAGLLREQILDTCDAADVSVNETARAIVEIVDDCVDPGIAKSMRSSSASNRANKGRIWCSREGIGSLPWGDLFSECRCCCIR